MYKLNNLKSNVILGNINFGTLYCSRFLQNLKIKWYICVNDISST